MRPYHRYLRYRLLAGDSDEEVVDHLADLEYLPPTSEELRRMRAENDRRLWSRDVRRDFGLTFFDEEPMERVFWIVETPVVRTALERLLLDRVPPKHAATIIDMKYGGDVKTADVERFRNGFWDTVTLTNVDFHEYFTGGGRRRPPVPPPMSLDKRPAYSAWREGLHPDQEELSPEDMVREIQVDSFMRYKEENDPKTAMDWAKLCLKTSSTARALAEARIGNKGRSFEVRTRLMYPKSETPTIGDLHSEYSEETSGTGDVSRQMAEKTDRNPA